MMKESDRTRYLVTHSYGQGGLWAYVMADSPSAIETKFRDVKIVFNPPPWLTAEEAAKLKTYDIDDLPDWLLELEKK